MCVCVCVCVRECARVCASVRVHVRRYVLPQPLLRPKDIYLLTLEKIAKPESIQKKEKN